MREIAIYPSDSLYNFFPPQQATKNQIEEILLFTQDYPYVYKENGARRRKN
jgi:predicted SPOUT superfamily RNA methylase MTH1